MKIIPVAPENRQPIPTHSTSIGRLTRKTLVLILAGGEGSRLRALTRWRAKPAVPFGGKYRIIDFALSNCVNSGLRRIGVLCQYKSHSLISHLQRAWSFLRNELGEFVEVLPAQQRVSKEWYRGTADALYQNLDIMHRHGSEYVLVLAGDHIYKADFSPMLIQHADTGADLTVCCIEVPRSQASAFGVMEVDDQGNIIGFSEKPTMPTGLPDNPQKALVSMGIYVFSTAYLYKCLNQDAAIPDSTHDFGRDIIPKAIKNCKAMAYRFKDDHGKPGYWKDVGTLHAYWQSNMELCDAEPALELYDHDWPIWTRELHCPPTKFIFDPDNNFGSSRDSLISSGCIISGAEVIHSVISTAARIERNCRILDSVILPNVKIGPDCRITKAIIDKDCVIPAGTIIGESKQADRERFHVTDEGITLVTNDMLEEHHRSLAAPQSDAA